MSKKLNEKSLIDKLSEEGFSPAEIARKIKIPYSTVCGHIKARKEGFASISEYIQDLARRNGFESYSKYQEHLANQKYYESLSEYQRSLAEKRANRLKNQMSSQLIKERLDKLGKTQRWLAERLGITESAISRYISGKTMPKRSIQEELINIIGAQYKILDDIIEIDK